jgi:ABC-type nitrate/sulfonate/bicarbonate transport system permease component
MRRDRWLSVFIGLALMAAWEAGVRLLHTSALVLPAPVWWRNPCGKAWPAVTC